MLGGGLFPGLASLTLGYGSGHPLRGRKKQVAYILNDSKRWRFFGRLDGDCYMHLYTNLSAYAVEAGHPVLADNPKVRITLDDPLGRQGAFEVYNPTDKPVTVTLRSNRFFVGKDFSVKVDLKPFESKRIDIGS